MGACAAHRWTPRVGAAWDRPRLRRGGARNASQPAPAVFSARSDDTSDPEPNAGDVRGGGDAGLVVDPCKKTGASRAKRSASSSLGRERHSVSGETTTTALALVPPTTALSPLMLRLNARSRTFEYPALGGMTLELRQAWSERDVGTGAAVWDAAAALADDLARDGGAVALRRFWDMASAELSGAEKRGARDSKSGGAFADGAPSDDARRWWRGAVVVELGAGLGTASLVAASLGARALATDGDESTCAMCARNARDNADAVLETARRERAAPSEDETRAALSARVPACRRLLWGDAGDARATKAWIRAQKRKRDAETATDLPDAILLADVVYGEDEATWCALARTLRALAGAETAVILSHTRRGGGRSMERFRAAAERAGFAVAIAETKSEPRDGFVAVTVTYVLRLATDAKASTR